MINQLSGHSLRSRTCILLLLVLWHLAWQCQATVFIQNQSYPSLPGLFGRHLIPGKRYQARVQYLRENPHLCLTYDENYTQSSYVVPPSTIYINNTTNTTATASVPVVLLASRGYCPFHYKAAIAQSIHPTVQFLIVYNFNAEGEDYITPMYSEYGDTRLKLLSVSHRTGHEIKRLIAEAPEEVLAQGGPLIEFDDSESDSVLSVDDLQELMVSALGLMFMMIALSGCMLVASSLQSGGSRQIVVTSSGGFALARTLLTQDEVHQLSDQVRQEPPSDDAPVRQQQENACAVCIEEFQPNEPDEEVIILPCHHCFHADCIIPWLTERQAKCPLCKFDVMEYMNAQHERERQEEQGVAPVSTSPHWMDRWIRYRWTSVGAQDHDDVENHVVISADEMESEGMEMPERNTTVV